MMEQLTDWFAPEIKPVHVGVYPTSFENAVNVHRHGYSHWNGRSWGNQYETPDRALRRGELGAQNKRWRGLATKPEVNHG